MLTIKEREDLKMIMKMMSEGESLKKKRNIDVSYRTRDIRGRFQSESKKKEVFNLRSIRVKKVKGTYGTYKIKTKWFSESEKDIIIVSMILLFYTIIL